MVALLALAYAAPAPEPAPAAKPNPNPEPADDNRPEIIEIIAPAASAQVGINLTRINIQNSIF